MRYLLSRASLPILKGLAQEKTLCAFDFDGTLAPIVDHPDEAGLPVPTRCLLARVAALYPCVILSGRARADLIGRLGGVPLEHVIGNHGAEAAGTTTNNGHVHRWKAAIELELGPMPGLWMEDKGLSLAVHYRQSPQKDEAKRRILRAARNLGDVRVFGGKQVVNIVVDGAPHKGAALISERKRLGCEWVLYVGDDENDEDAFAIGGNTVSVRVGRSQRSHAKYYLRGQIEIDKLLELLVTLRESVSAK
jgi:trehalose 6-phosphate phosphatase